MPIVKVVTKIRAPIDACFDHARDIRLHTESTAGTNERAIAGVTAGLIGPGCEVTWEATHLMVRWRLSSRITAFERPFHFRDSQVTGPFQGFDHDHIFATVPGGTLMTDVFAFQSPYGLAGRLVDRLFLRSYMERFLRNRSEFLKAHAENLVLKE
jgi:ligand-binding SRPBCC domain-containing protein